MSIASEISRLMGDSLAIAQAIEAKGVTVPQGSGFDDYAGLIGQISGSEPFPFTKLSYLQTNGANYIITPVTFSSSSSYVIQMKLNIVSGSQNYGTGWNAGGGLFVQKSGSSFVYGNGSTALSAAIAINNIIELNMVIGSGTTNYVALKDRVISSASRANTSLSNYAGTTGFPIGVTTNTGGTVPHNGVSLRLYGISIKKDFALVFDGIPVISTEATENDRGQTVQSGTVGLYDFVTKKFYTNRASGTDFTPGY